MNYFRLIFAITVLSTVSAFGQCGRLVVNPTTFELDCIGSASGSGTVSSSTTHFVAVYSGATTVGGVTPGTAGKVFTSNGTGADPSFQTLPGSSTGGLTLPVSAPPAAATWTGVNTVAGQSLTDSTGGGLAFTMPLNASTNLRMYCVSLVAAPYTYTSSSVGFIAGGGNQRLFPLALRESGTGKITTFGLNQNINGVGIDDWTNATTFAAAHNPQILTGSLWGGFRYFRVNNDNTNLNYSMSFDGVNFHQIFSTLIAAFFTVGPDQACFGGDSEGTVSGVVDIGFTVFYWSQT